MRVVEPTLAFLLSLSYVVKVVRVKGRTVGYVARCFTGDRPWMAAWSGSSMTALCATRAEAIAELKRNPNHEMR
jgi:hypothetical protein